MSSRNSVLLADDGQLALVWPLVRGRLEERLADSCDVRYVDVRESPLADVDLSEVQAIALFSGDFTAQVAAAAPALRVVAAVTDALGVSGYSALRARSIPLVDVTRAWAPSVAECGLALALCALRQIPQRHIAIAEGTEDWTYCQDSDDPRWVHDDLGTKRVAMIGMGQIGSRMADWCAMLGSRVIAYDPYAPEERFTHCERANDLDAALRDVEVLFVAVPPTPSATGMIDAGRVDALPRGTVIVTVTRAAGIDCQSLRRRVLADELFWAADVFDVEPLPLDDPIRGRHNVVHIPHVAGRTGDTNIRVADMMADDILRVLGGEPAEYALSLDAIRLRGGELTEAAGS